VANACYLLRYIEKRKVKTILHGNISCRWDRRAIYDSF
jgi:hypothetical protein